MKMRKILSGIVAGAIAASAMMIGASAATVARTIEGTAGTKKAVFTGSVSFTEMNFRVGTSMDVTIDPIKFFDSGKNFAGDSNLQLGVTGLTINGVKTAYNAVGFNNAVTTNIQFGVSEVAGSNSWENDAELNIPARLSAGKYNSFKFTIDVTVQDKSNGYAGDPEYSAKLADGGYFKDGDKKASAAVKIEPLGQVVLVGDSSLVPAGTDVTGKVEFTGELADGGDVTLAGAGSKTFNYGKMKLTVAEKGIIKKAKSARIDLTLKDVDADITLLKVKVDDTDNVATTGVSKGATTASIEIPVEKIYDADYDSAFENIVVSIGSGKIVAATLTFEDGVADAETPAEGEEGDEPAEGDEGDEPAEGDDEDLTSGDDEEEDDDVDTDFEEEDDDTAEEDDFGESDDSVDASGDDSQAAGDDDATTDGAAAGETETANNNPKTGVAVAVIPALVAAAAVVVARKRK